MTGSGLLTFSSVASNSLSFEHFSASEIDVMGEIAQRHSKLSSINMLESILPSKVRKLRKVTFERVNKDTDCCHPIVVLPLPLDRELDQQCLLTSNRPRFKILGLHLDQSFSNHRTSGHTSSFLRNTKLMTNTYRSPSIVNDQHHSVFFPSMEPHPSEA